jgi:hypothetical protein
MLRMGEEENTCITGKLEVGDCTWVTCERME